METSKGSTFRKPLIMALGALIGTIIAAVGIDYWLRERSMGEIFQHWGSSAFGAPVGAFIGGLIGDAIRRKRLAK